MEVKKSINGKRIWTAEQKREILAELDAGYTPISANLFSVKAQSI
jgi:hypothetical protein